MARIIQQIVTWFDVDGNPTRIPSKAVVIRSHVEFGDGTVEIEEFVAEDKKVEKSLPVEEIEKGIKGFLNLVKRTLQFFRGRDGLWVTKNGKRIFLDAGNLPPLLKPKGVTLTLSEISEKGAEKFLRKNNFNVSDIAKGFLLDHKGFKVNDLKIDIFGPSFSAGSGSMVAVKGNIVDSGGLTVGNFSRSILPDINQAYHGSLLLDRSVQGKGISGALMRNHLELYRKLGLKEIELMASGQVGKYAWAVQGFNFSNITSPGPINKITTLKSLRDGFVTFLTKKTNQPVEVWSKIVGNFDEPIDFAKFRWKGEKLGKEFLLSPNTKSWAGTFDLDPNSNSSKIFEDFITKRG